MSPRPENAAVWARVDAPLREGRLPHAVIFECPDGATALRYAELAALRLVCETGTACGECGECRLARSGSHPDISLYAPDKTVFSVELARRVIEDAAVKPDRAPVKILILRGADKMSEQAQNALLKTLEEPPGNAKFILLAANAGSLLPTVRSRCATYAFLPEESAGVGPGAGGVERSRAPAGGKFPAEFPEKSPEKSAGKFPAESPAEFPEKSPAKSSEMFPAESDEKSLTKSGGKLPGKSGGKSPERPAPDAAPDYDAVFSLAAGDRTLDLAVELNKAGRSRDALAAFCEGLSERAVERVRRMLKGEKSAWSLAGLYAASGAASDAARALAANANAQLQMSLLCEKLVRAAKM